MTDKPNIPEENANPPVEITPLSNEDMLAEVTNAEKERDLAIEESRKLTDENSKLVLSNRTKDEENTKLKDDLAVVRARLTSQDAELVRLRGRSDEIEVWRLGVHQSLSYPVNNVQQTAIPVREPFVYEGQMWTPFTLPKAEISRWDEYNSFLDQPHEVKNAKGDVISIHRHPATNNIVYRYPK